MKGNVPTTSKVTYTQFELLKEDFLADDKTELLMIDIPQDLMFYWDQIPIQLVPTGEWTMNHAKENLMKFDDKMPDLSSCGNNYC